MCRWDWHDIASEMKNEDVLLMIMYILLVVHPTTHADVKCISKEYENEGRRNLSMTNFTFNWCVSSGCDIADGNEKFPE